LERALLKIHGIVQGVGFRPFIHKLVGEYGLCGYIKNTSSGVELEVEGEKAMLERLGIGKYFEKVIGATPDEAVSTKDQVIEEALKRMGITHRRMALMIGDRKHDVLGAKKCGLDSFGGYMGCAEPGEHEGAGATYIASSIEELKDVLLTF